MKLMAMLLCEASNENAGRLGETASGEWSGCSANQEI